MAGAFSLTFHLIGIGALAKCQVTSSAAKMQKIKQLGCPLMLLLTRLGPDFVPAPRLTLVDAHRLKTRCAPLTDNNSLKYRML